MVFFEFFKDDLIGLCIALLTIVIVYFKWSFQYWKRKKLPYLEPKIPFGNFYNSIFSKENFGLTVKHFYDTMKDRGWKHGGVYIVTEPRYVVVNLEYVKNILTTDFPYFTDRGFHYNEENDPLTGNLFLLGGVKWRNLRTKLTSTFTSKKMKTMFKTLLDCTHSLLDKVDGDNRKNLPINIKKILGCFTTDVIGSCAFGIECNTFKEENSFFNIYGKKVFTITGKTKLKSFFSINYPSISKYLGLTYFDKEIRIFFINMVKETVNYREKNKVTRNDFLQLLIDLKNNKLAEEEDYQHDGRTLTIEELAAQCFIFFIAGFETSSTAMTFALYELAKRQDLQQKVRDEINTVLAKHDGKITYNAIQEMKYMDQVINETLRKYPPVPLITRECISDYKVPDEDLIIEKNTLVYIPIMGIHLDKEYYPHPDKFDPERFTKENKLSRHPYAHIPFGEGPRLCIGMRFGLMQSKVGLTVLLKNYIFTVNKKTQEPLEIDANAATLSAKEDIWLNTKTVNNN